MSALDQLLAQLDREDVTELVVATGRPIAMRKGAAYVALTAKPLGHDQLASLVAGTPIELPRADGMRPAEDVTIGRRTLRIQIGRRGGEIVLRIERATTTQAPRAKTPTQGPRAKTPTQGPRAKTPTQAPRARTPTQAPRAKTPTQAPRAKTPTQVPRPGRTTRAPRPTEPPALRAARAASTPRGPRASGELELAPEDLVPISGGDAASPPEPPAAFAELVATARERGASDLHIAAGRAVAIRIGGELVALDSGAAPLATAAAEAMLLGLLGPPQQAQLASAGYADLAVDVPGGGRLRANVSRHQGGLKGTFRIARESPASLEELGLPAQLAKVVAHHQGLVVVAGPSGHGKTTTLAALVDLLNSSKACHILTIEDPIEIVHPRKAAVVSQREAGRHTRTFATGLKASLREDPDVIVIGELRDRETVEIALTAAETGHLVLSTMSTPSAAKTIDRLIDMFPAEEHTQVRASIAGALRAIVAQRLLPAVAGGVVPAVELVTGVLPLAVLIRDDKLYQLPNLMQRGRAFGMLRFDDSLLELARAGKIAEATALAVAEGKKEVAAQLRPGKAAGP